MLISKAVTLLMMAAVVNLFANVGAGVRNRRASMELGGQLRLARARLFKDLAGATSSARPKLPSDDHDDGYIELIEGGRSDRNPSALIDGNLANGELDYAVSLVPSGGDPQIVIDANTNDSNVRVPQANDITNGGGLGDYDDILALTVRSENAPFVGRLAVWNPATSPPQWEYTTIQSNLAEVIWYSVENPANGSLGEPGMRTIYRRVLLIAPWTSNRTNPLQMIPPYTNQSVALPNGNSVTVNGLTNDRACYEVCDVSFRREGNLRIPNTLSDLTKRENRFAHHINGATVYPHIIQTDNIWVAPLTDLGPLHPFGAPFFPASDRGGEDVMLNDVLAFDLRVYDPGAPLFEYRGVIVEPTADRVFRDAVATNVLSGFGAYVDLGWDNNYDYPANPNTPARYFQEERQVGWHPRFPNNRRGTPSVYDTWPYHYENDGLDQSNRDGDNNVNTGVDEGTDGLDTDGVNGVDDALERETSPPYDTPLRAMQVKMRVYERDTRQIREATVTRNFVPQ